MQLGLLLLLLLLQYMSGGLVGRWVTGLKTEQAKDA